MTQLRFQRMGRGEMETFAVWFTDAELSRRISAPTEPWLAHVGAGTGNFAWLVYEAEQAVGQVQLDTDPDGTGSMSLVVNPPLRSRGYGRHILKAFLRQEEALPLREITACIEADNAASLRCFRASGFVAREAEPDSNGLIEHVYQRETAPVAVLRRATAEDMTVRPYESTDEQLVIALWHACGLVVPWNDPAQDISLKSQVQPELFLVGIVEDQVVASIMAGYDGHRGWLYSLAVAPDLQRQGLGRRMVAEAESRLAALGCRKVNLQVRASNAAVIGFYESLGFAVEDRVSLGKRLPSTQTPA